MSDSTRRILPVVRWLQVGSAAAGLGVAVGMASVASPAVAWADDDVASASDSARSGPSNSRADSRHKQRSVRQAGDSEAVHPTRTAPPRPAAATRQSSDDLPVAELVEAAAASSVRPSPAAVQQAATTAKAVQAPSAAPGIGSLASTLRLNLEDVFTGTGKPKVTNPTAVVTGLFHEVLRRDPTASELQNYLRRLNFSGVNGVVAGLYNSKAFRQNAVNNYYAELLGRVPDQKELNNGVLRYTLGGSEAFVASQALAGGQKVYDYSASGGGPRGSKPSPDSYVNLLYRALLGESVGVEAEPLIQSIQQGMPLSRVASQFVSSDAYRSVKVGQIYQVLGQEPSPTEIADYVRNWIWKGGQAGISQSLLATSANISRIEAGLVPLPDAASAQLLQSIMLSEYGAFVSGLKQQLQGGGDSDEGQKYGCRGSVNTSKCNEAFFILMSTGGSDRGIPNDALETATNFVQTTNLIPTQNNVDMDQSLIYPLRSPSTAELYLTGGPIAAPGGIVLTADDGQYVLDGHHRWSALYVMNPYTSIASIDVGYVPTPQSGLKEIQMAIGAREGYLPWKEVSGENLYQVPEEIFKAKVYEYIWKPEVVTKDPEIRYRQDDTDPDSDGYLRPKVFNEFTNFLTDDVEIPGVPKGALTEAQQIQYTRPIEDYLWGNVLRMRQYNEPIPFATDRKDMPQPLGNAYPPYLQLLEAGDVIYTLPSISALG